MIVEDTSLEITVPKKIDEISSVSEDMTTVLSFFCHQMLLNERWIHPRTCQNWSN